MAYIDFISAVHRSTRRDYLSRVVERPKAELARIARRYDREYWDGDRSTGYGGYHYDGRWRPVADVMVKHYGLQPGDRVLDVGCGKAFLLYEFTLALPGAVVAGVDLSPYALANTKKEIAPFVRLGNANRLPFPDKSFDLVISINTIHNLYCYDAYAALQEIERVGRRHKYICVESYRSEEEKVNLLYWQLTCEMFFNPDEWKWWFNHTGYTGDYSFMFFE